MKKRIKIRYPLNFQPYISKLTIAKAEENYKDLYGKNNHPWSRLSGFPCNTVIEML